MSFRTFQRLEDGTISVGAEEPDPELRETDEPKVGWFVLVKSFCYRVPADPQQTVYIVPGADAPSQSTPSQTTTTDGSPVVIPPNDGGRTDLASVPPFLWWLIASYGNHTRAALLHDALYANSGQVAPVPRAVADRLFLTALREPGQKEGAFRHWVMWVGVSLFGTMRKWHGAIFLLQVLLIWGLLAAAVIWAWGPWTWDIAWPWWRVPVVAVAAVIAFGLFLVVLGFSWRFGVDLRRGWLFPDVLIGGLILVPLVLRWSSKDWWSPFTLLLAAAVLMLLGLFWGGAVDRTLRMWLWPTGLVGLQIAAIPLAFIGLAVSLVWFIDLGAAFARARRKDALGNEQSFEMPTVKRFQLRV